MKEIILVGFGGFIGSVLRYYSGTLASEIASSSNFPFGTLAINTAGCFAIGLIFGLTEKYTYLSPQIRLLVITGLLGGFTTFSAFGLETVSLVMKGYLLNAGLYICLSVTFGLLSVWCGLHLVK